MNDTFLKLRCRGEKQRISLYGLCARQADISPEYQAVSGQADFLTLSKTP